MAVFSNRSAYDPKDNSIPGVYHWKSVSSTGTSTDASYNDLQISSSPNFPVGSSSTPTRYILDLPGQPYYTKIADGTYTCVIKNINTSTILTRVAYNGTLTANTYKIFPETANDPGYLEVHVGTGSNQANNMIAFDTYFINNIPNAKQVSGNYTYTFATISSRNYGWAERIIGSTEDAGAILNSYIDSTSKSGTIFLKSGIYNIVTPINTQYGMNIIGESQETVILNASSGCTVVLKLASSNLSCLIRFLSFYTTISSSAHAITGINSDKHKIEDVYISGFNGNGIEYCNNIINCKIVNVRSAAFSYCNYLTNCMASSNSFSFSYCNYLTNCYGVNSTLTDFVACNYLTNCNSSNNNNTGGFGGCFYLSNCVGSSSYYAFKSCWFVNNCYADTNENAFYECYYVNNSYAFNSTSYGFYGCLNIHNNKSYNNTVNYSTNSSPGSSIGVTPADTANGGWNSL